MWQRVRTSAMTLTKPICLGATLLLTALVASGAPVLPVSECTPSCAVPQTPRNINPTPGLGLYFNTSTVSTVRVSPDEGSLVYTYSCDGHPVSKTLYRCSRHYHCPIEDVQGCAGDERPPVACTENPAVGQWIEVHTAYSASPTPNCPDPQGLTCCTGDGPVVVRAYSATVGEGGPILQGRLAEWSGSDTGVTPVGACRPTAAQWSFVLGCGFKVPLSQLTGLKKKEARQLQGGLRVSRDLTLVSPTPR
jgi:hypothetical protein